MYVYMICIYMGFVNEGTPKWMVWNGTYRSNFPAVLDPLKFSQERGAEEGNSDAEQKCLRQL